LIYYNIIEEYKKKTSYSSLTPKINESVYNKFCKISFSLLYINQQTNTFHTKSMKIHNHQIKSVFEDGKHWKNKRRSNHGQRARNRSGSSGTRSRRGCRRQILSGGDGEEKRDGKDDGEGVKGECLRCHGLKERKEKENENLKVLGGFVFILWKKIEGGGIYNGVERRVGPTEHGQLCGEEHVWCFWGVN